MNRSPETSPKQAGTQQPIRPPYLREDPWSSSTPPKDKSHWTRVRQLLKKCDGDTIGSWQEEINTQLIVASLLSALTGAFVIETEKNLSEDPIVTAAVLLSHIAMQINASTVLPPSTLQPFSNPPRNARAVNSLLYLSLGFSLSNVIVGLLCLQWLRELRADTPGIPDRTYTSVHFVRHIGFQKWGAKGLVSTLPLLLLFSLTCFFTGLLCHVSKADWVVSVPVGIVVGITFAVLLLTTLLPAAVIAGCTAFHPGLIAKSGSFPPIPPFQSLQSWIVLQFAVTILGSPIFKKVTTYPGRLRSLKFCPDWGHLSWHWGTDVASVDPVILPFLHSSGNSSTFDDIALCLADNLGPQQSLDRDPVRKEIQTLCNFIELYFQRLPSCTSRDLYNKLATQLVQYFNGGGDFVDLGFPVTTFAMNILCLLPDSQTQLLHAVVQSYERNEPVDEVSWDFFWLAFGLCINTDQHFDKFYMLVIRALDVVGEFRHPRPQMTMLGQYRHFVGRFSLLVTSYRPFTATGCGRRVVASILFHPVWNDLELTARQLPPCPDVEKLWHRLDILDGVKRMPCLREYALQLFPHIPHLYPDSEPSQSYTAVDMDPTDPVAEAKVEEIPFQTDAGPLQPHISVGVDLAEAKVKDLPLSSIPLLLDVDEHAVDSFLPIMPAPLSLSPMDSVERDGEEATDDPIIPSVEETDHHIPTLGSFFAPASVYTKIGDAGPALREEEAEKVYDESGSSASAPLLPRPMDVVEREGEGKVVDKRLAGPGSSVPTSRHREAGWVLDVEQGFGQCVLHRDEEKEG